MDTSSRLHLESAARLVLERVGHPQRHLELTNVANRRNPCCIDDFDFTLRNDGSLDIAPDEDYGLPFIPSLSIGLTF